MRPMLLMLAGLSAIIGAAAPSRSPPPPSPAATARELVVAAHVEHLGFEAFEPMLVQREGLLVVAAQGGPWSSESDYAANPAYWAAQWRARLWMSSDQGASWKQANLGPDPDRAVGNSDVDIAVAPDGTLYFASMKWDEGVRKGQGIAVGVSRDAGASWKWTKLASRVFDDRPWVVVAPDGAAHLIWNDDRGVQHVVSRDGGQSWSGPVRIYPPAGSSHLAVGPHGELAARLIPWTASHNFRHPGADLIAISTDGGTTWKTSPAPGHREWGTWAANAAHDVRKDGVEEFAGKDVNRCCSGYDIPRWIEPLAWDGKGRLYSLWTDATGVWLARSVDRGATWKTWKIVESGVPCFFPYLIARRDGELAASWHSGKGFEGSSKNAGDSLGWQAAKIDIGHGRSAPQVIKSPLLELDTFSWGDTTHASGVQHQPAGEYLPLTFLRGGGVGVITPIQDPRAHRVGFTYWRFAAR
jgi:hypothetical protein